MKNSEEMARELLERRDRYAVLQKRRRKLLLCTVTPLFCLCVMGCISYFVWQDAGQKEEPQKETKKVISQTKENGKEEQSEKKNKIVVEYAQALPADSAKKRKGELLAEDFVELNRSQMCEYYGTNVFPTVPSDLKEWQDRHGIYKKNGGTGAVYEDHDILNYSTDDFERSVNVEIAKGDSFVSDCAFFQEIKEKSIINNVAVALAKADDDYYYAQFLYHGAGFQIIAKGLTEQEMVDVISSLLQ